MNEITHLPYTHMIQTKVWDLRSSCEVMVWGYHYYTKNGKKRFITKTDLDDYFNRQGIAFQTYIRWRIMQNGPFGNDSQEFYNYYLEWLREQGRELSLTRPKQPF
jgi:hypothetical protein